MGNCDPVLEMSRGSEKVGAFIHLTNIYGKFPHVRHCLSSHMKITESSEEGMKVLCFKQVPLGDSQLRQVSENAWILGY